MQSLEFLAEEEGRGVGRMVSCHFARLWQLNPLMKAVINKCTFGEDCFGKVIPLCVGGWTGGFTYSLVTNLVFFKH